MSNATRCRAISIANRAAICGYGHEAHSVHHHGVRVGLDLADIDHHLLEPIDLSVERLAALDAREPVRRERPF
eukprot:3407285-Prymnesium_polylepis.2